MKAGSRAGLLLVLCAVLGTSSACNSPASNEAPKVKYMGGSLPAAPPVPLTGEVPGVPRTASDTNSLGGAVVTPKPSEPLYGTRIIHIDSGAPPKEDPDARIIAAARAPAGACFTGITDNSTRRSARIMMTVVPSGSVSRTEVVSDSPEPAILDCLKGVGDSQHFTDKPDAGIRTLAIDVTVTRDH